MRISRLASTSIRSRDWPDILLEQWSDEERRIPGWVQKPLACDFIAYAYAPSGVCYLLPVPALQRAWRMHGRAWIERYGVRRALNFGYITASVPVPRGELMRAIADALVLGPTTTQSDDGDQLPLALEEGPGNAFEGSRHASIARRPR